mgnify:CR=1
MNDTDNVSEIVEKYFALKEQLTVLGYHPVGFANREIVKALGSNLSGLLECNDIPVEDIGNGRNSTNILLIDWDFIPKGLQARLSVEAMGL